MTLIVILRTFGSQNTKLCTFTIFLQERSDHEQTKHRVFELTCKIQSAADGTTLLVQERDILKEKVNEERARCNMMERQLCDKQNLASELLKKCVRIFQIQQ